MNDRRILSIRPKMLMLSHCLPQYMGDADQMRAWQLLELASVTHAIHLACVVPQRVSMTQWKPLARHTEKLALEPLSIRQRVSLWLRRKWNASDKLRVMLRHALHNPAELLDTQAEYDAVLCTHSDLWPRVAPISARLRICDMGHITQADATQHAAAWQCDVLMLRLAEDAGCFISAPCHKLIVPFATAQTSQMRVNDRATVELARLLSRQNQKPRLAAA